MFIHLGDIVWTRSQLLVPAK